MAYNIQHTPAKSAYPGFIFDIRFKTKIFECLQSPTGDVRQNYIIRAFRLWFVISGQGYPE